MANQISRCTWNWSSKLFYQSGTRRRGNRCWKRNISYEGRDLQWWGLGAIYRECIMQADLYYFSASSYTLTYAPFLSTRFEPRYHRKERVRCWVQLLKILRIYWSICRRVRLISKLRYLESIFILAIKLKKLNIVRLVSPTKLIGGGFIN